MRPAGAEMLTVLLPMLSWTVAGDVSIARADTASAGKLEFLGNVPVEQTIFLGYARYQKTTSSFFSVQCVSMYDKIWAKSYIR
jgi:hypothetical protein